MAQMIMWPCKCGVMNNYWKNKCKCGKVREKDNRYTPTEE